MKRKIWAILRDLENRKEIPISGTSPDEIRKKASELAVNLSLKNWNLLFLKGEK